MLLFTVRRLPQLESQRRLTSMAFAAVDRTSGTGSHMEIGFFLAESGRKLGTERWLLQKSKRKAMNESFSSFYLTRYTCGWRYDIGCQASRRILRAPAIPSQATLSTYAGKTHGRHLPPHHRGARPHSDHGSVPAASQGSSMLFRVTALGSAESSSRQTQRLWACLLRKMGNPSYLHAHLRFVWKVIP